jgi:hypothetical protein
VSLETEIAETKDRIAAAEYARAAWLRSGMQEKYLQSCSMVDALALQLERLEKARPAAPPA